MRDKTLIRIGLALGLCLTFFYITATRLDPDLGWHLRVGQDILQNREAPRADTFSHTMPGYEWVDHEWLADAFLAYLDQNGLWILVVILFTLLGVLPFVVWLWRSETDLGFLFVTMAALLTANHIGVRAQIISFFFSFLVLEILRKRARISFWFLPILFLAWVNLHGGFFLGLGILGLFVILSPRRFDGWVVLGLSFALTFVNPYGTRIYGEVFSVLSSSDTSRYIAEWQSAFVHAALKDSAPLSVLFFIIQLVFIACFLWLGWRYRRRFQLPVLAASGFMLLGYAKSLRLGPIFFVSALPILLPGLVFLKEEVLKLRTAIGPTRQSLADGQAFSQNEQRVFRVLKMSVAIILLAFTIFLVVFPGRERGYPVQAVNFLRESLTPDEIGLLFNEYAWGGYLIRNLPEVKVFIDGRMPHWTGSDGYSAMAEYVSVFYPPKGESSRFREVLNGHGIQTVIIFVPRCNISEFSTDALNVSYMQDLAKIPCQMIAGLTLDGWKVIFQDKSAIVLHKM